METIEPSTRQAKSIDCLSPAPYKQQHACLSKRMIGQQDGAGNIRQKAGTWANEGNEADELHF
jgi:hypothetical protein